MSDKFESQKGQLIHDLRAVIHDVQALMQTNAEEYRGDSEELKKSIQQKLSHTMGQLHQMERQASEQIAHSAQQAKAYVEHHPLQAISISAGIGLLIGLLIKRH